MVCVDAVAYAPHRPVDVQALDVDFYAFSFYKTFGPHHAVLYGKYDALVALPVQNHFFVTPEMVPYKFQPGNVNYEMSYGCIAIGEYLEALGQRGDAALEGRAAMVAGFDAIAAHEADLSRRFLDYLSRRAGRAGLGHDVERRGGAGADDQFHGRRARQRRDRQGHGPA